MSGEPSVDRGSDGRGVGRSSKRQIVCFLTPHMNHAARVYAQSKGLTRQALLGRAINQYLETVGERRHLNEAVTRIVCMTNRRIRRFHNPYGRYGKSALAGWFHEEAVNEAAISLMRHGSNFQHAAESGLDLLGIKPVDGTDLDQHVDDSVRSEAAGEELDSDEGVLSGTPAVMPELISREVSFPDF